jgi:uncharacterized protein (DUF1684 family)
MSELSDFRKAKDYYFGQDHDSPLTTGQQKRFAGLAYFPENTTLQFAVAIEELPDLEKETIQMATSTGDFLPYIRWGTISFPVSGQSATLTVYRGEDGDGFFLPFGDLSSGQTSYGEGRYLDLVPSDHGRFLVDFNYAYNPYCAYNPNWSCPIPPMENRLTVAIDAGEKIFPDAEGH